MSGILPSHPGLVRSDVLRCSCSDNSNLKQRYTFRRISSTFPRRFGLGVMNQVNNLMLFSVEYSIKAPPGLLRLDTVRIMHVTIWANKHSTACLYRNINGGGKLAIVCILGAWLKTTRRNLTLLFRSYK